MRMFICLLRKSSFCKPYKIPLFLNTIRKITPCISKFLCICKSLWWQKPVRNVSLPHYLICPHCKVIFLICSCIILRVSQDSCISVAPINYIILFINYNYLCLVLIILRRHYVCCSYLHFELLILYCFN